MKINVDLIYPIGSTYASSVNVSPQTIFGGTWEVIPRNYLTYVSGTVNSQVVPSSSWYSLATITLSAGTWFICGGTWRSYSGKDATIRFAGGAPESRKSFYCADGNVYSANTSCICKFTEQKTIYLQTWTATGNTFNTSYLYAFRLDGFSTDLYMWKRTA